MSDFVKSSILFIAFSFFAHSAMAQGYAGIGFGKAEADVAGIDLGDDTGMKIFGGYKFNKNIAFEAAYIDFGEITLTGNGSLTLEASGLDFSVVGSFPINQSFELFAKIGMLMWDADAIYVNVPGFGSGTESDDGSDIGYGFGANFNVGSNLAIRASYEMFELDDVDVDLLSAAVIFNF
jgi:OOP family OmpA-OmpF porin